jgi:superfamily II DNA or RNA helicase
MDSMAEVVSVYFPKPRPPLDDNHLRPVSDISVHPSRLADLRTFLNDKRANFSCPEQALLLELMVQAKQSVLAILGTSSGKTMILMMYAKMYSRGRVTVVVLPVSGLHADFERRVKGYSMSVSRWAPNGKFNGNVNIVYVSIEHIGFDGFKEYVTHFIIDLLLIVCFRYIKTLENTKMLHTIAFEEVHKMLTDIRYREAFHEFYALNLVKTPKIGLTGTLGPHLIDEFFRLTETTWRIIRTSSVRKEVKHEIRRVPRKKMEDIVVRDVNELVAGYSDKECAIVFCATRDSAVRVARALGLTPVISARNETDENTAEANERTVLNWITGKDRAIVGTSIIGTGINRFGVRHVIQCGLAFNMMDQHQQEGRGGRDGEPYAAITYVPDDLQPPAATGGIDLGAGDLFRWANSTDQCSRIIPSINLDGVATTCSLLPGCALCQYCTSQLTSAAKNEPQRLPLALPLKGTSDVSPRTFQTPKVRFHGNPTVIPSSQRTLVASMPRQEPVPFPCLVESPPAMSYSPLLVENSSYFDPFQNSSNPVTEES